MSNCILGSKLVIHINGKEIGLLDISLNINEIKTIDDFQIFLNIMTKINCCKGISYSTELLSDKSVFGQNLFESDGQWRHKNCLTILNDNR